MDAAPSPGVQTWDGRNLPITVDYHTPAIGVLMPAQNTAPENDERKFWRVTEHAGHAASAGLQQRARALAQCTLPGPGPHAEALGFEPVEPATEKLVADLVATIAYLRAAQTAAVSYLASMEANHLRMAELFSAGNRSLEFRLREERRWHESESQQLQTAVNQLASMLPHRGLRDSETDLDHHRSAPLPTRIQGNQSRASPASPSARPVRSPTRPTQTE